MLNKLWRRLLWPGMMRDADRLIAAHGSGAYGMARLGATAAREIDEDGHWSSVAREVARRLEQDRCEPEDRLTAHLEVERRGDDTT